MEHVYYWMHSIDTQTTIQMTINDATLNAEQRNVNKLCHTILIIDIPLQNCMTLQLKTFIKIVTSA